MSNPVIANEVAGTLFKDRVRYRSDSAGSP